MTPDLLQLVAPAVAALAAAIVGMDRRLVRKLRRGNAVSAESAIRPNGLPLLSRWRLSRLTSAAAVRVTANGSIYLDESGWEAYRRRRRVRVLAVLSFAAAVGLSLWILGVIVL